MKKNIKKTSKEAKQISPKPPVALVAAAVASGAVGTALTLAASKTALLGLIYY